MTYLIERQNAVYDVLNLLDVPIQEAEFHSLFEAGQEGHRNAHLDKPAYCFVKSWSPELHEDIGVLVDEGSIRNDEGFLSVVK